MNPPSNARFCALLVLVAVAACASPSATTSLPFGARTVAGKSTQRPVLYVSETHSNAVYTFDPANIAAGPAGKITAGINRPGALAVGPDGVLYVTNTFGNNVTLYKAGATSPFRTIASTFGVPERVAVSADNTLAIAYTKGFRKSGELVIYDKGSATPTRSVVIPLLKNNLLLSVIGLAIDASDNIFLSTSRYAVGPGLMQKYAPGSTTGVNTGLTPDIEGGFDSAGNMYVGFSNSVCVYAPGGTHCARRITKGLSSVTPFAVAPDGTLFVPDGSHYSNGEPQNGDVTEFAPGGSSPVAKFSSSSFVDPEGAALGFLP